MDLLLIEKLRREVVESQVSSWRVAALVDKLSSDPLAALNRCDSTSLAVVVEFVHRGAHTLN